MIAKPVCEESSSFYGICFMKKVHTFIFCVFKAVGKGLDIVISHPEAVIKNMNEWCLKTFSANGLIDEIRRSSITMKEAENMVGWSSSQSLGSAIGIAEKHVKRICEICNTLAKK